MKQFLIAALILVARQTWAQEIHCPGFYPAQDIVLQEVPSQHQGKGILRKQPLTGATWMGGELNDTFGELEGGRTEVKGGADIAVPAFARWLVCWYGPGRALAWWEQLDLAGEKRSNCWIELRSDGKSARMAARLVCR